MGWEWAIEQDKGRLRRFIALLFALSAIALRASRAPAPLRRLLRSVLVRAAPVAMNYVEADGPVCFDTGDSRDDLEYLAALFRTAARALTMWLNCAPAQASSFGARNLETPYAGGTAIAKPNSQFTVRQAAPAFDTS
jgi:hypothetical protein